MTCNQTPQAMEGKTEKKKNVKMDSNNVATFTSLHVKNESSLSHAFIIFEKKNTFYLTLSLSTLLPWLVYSIDRLIDWHKLHKIQTINNKLYILLYY